MPNLMFDGEVIPVAHLLPDDVLVFSIPKPMAEHALAEVRHLLRNQFPEPRKILVMDSGISLTVGRDGIPIPLGES